LFFELQSNYNTNRQNTVFLSARVGSKKLNAHKDTVTKWMRELEHYGFVVMVQGAHLGVHGSGKAAHYRLTDRPYAGKAPTYDFQNWSGELFDYKKQNPVRLDRTPRPRKPDIRHEARVVEITKKRPTEPDIRNAPECPTRQDIDSLTSSFETRLGSEAEIFLPLSSKPKLVWSTPVLTEVTGAEKDELLAAMSDMSPQCEPSCRPANPFSVSINDSN
jgi:hypothetical protein